MAVIVGGVVVAAALLGRRVDDDEYWFLCGEDRVGRTRPDRRLAGRAGWRCFRARYVQPREARDAVYARGSRTNEDALGERRPDDALRPSTFSRAAMLGHPVQIIQRPGFAFVFTEAYPVYRIIPTTGRAHTAPQYLFPTYMGDSTARWEGDTLVVDVISFNGEGWLASALDKPTSASTGVWLTSDALHVVERWRPRRCRHARVSGESGGSEDTDDAVGDFCDHLQTAGSREDRRGPVPPGGWSRYLSRPPGIVNSLPNGKPQLRF
jgi:hypothetical protein